MSRAILCVVAWSLISLSALQAEERFLVENGQARAEIVLAEQPSRSTRLAAHELRRYVEKVTGARLSIVTRPTGQMPVHVFVGQSTHTDQLKIATDELKFGAYRIVSGDDWLALIGDDTDFTPIEPYPRGRGDVSSGRLQKAWNEIIGEEWGVPNDEHYKQLLRLAGDTGLPDGPRPAGKLPPLELWDFDERGSFNAVCGFLRELGVRWFMPGELGEVVPKSASIALPKIDRTVHPDFPLRCVNIPFGLVGEETALFSMRLGLRHPTHGLAMHGMGIMTRQPGIFAKHPDWFALYGGKRDLRANRPNQVEYQNCFSNEELFQHTVRYARTQFDLYKEEMVSVMPTDGYSAICQCPLCRGKDTPDRPANGVLSDHVWDFVNRVAHEVRKTHPDKKVLCEAYNSYTLPPLKIDKLEPNVVVQICGGRRPVNSRAVQQEECRKLRESWLPKTHNPLLIVENYPYIDQGFYLPSFTARTLVNSVKATIGQSQGDTIWLPSRALILGPEGREGMLGLYHFLIYFTARAYWDGTQGSAEELLREYCRLFYGPAENEMHAFFTHCEANWQEMERDIAKVDRALELFATAQARVDKDSTYDKRLAVIDEYLKTLRKKRVQLAQKRGPVPVVRVLHDSPGKIVIDGKLDDEAWQHAPAFATGQFVELQTGNVPTFATSFKVAWIGSDLYFGIRCAERPGEKLNIGTTRNKDWAIWNGDAIEVLLATDARSYYQIAVNPSGATVNLDRAAGRGISNWDSQSEVATHVANDHWTVEMRIPVTADDSDPFHRVVGRRPTASLPWFVNVCRQRIRDDVEEASAFAPTAADRFHHPLKFAHFYDGLHHDFDADPTVTDYVIANRAAKALMLQGKHAEALKVYLSLAEGQATSLQKSVALAQSAVCARNLKDLDGAAKLAERIPIPSFAKTTQMQNLLAGDKAAELIAGFGKEDIAAWPFWQCGSGYFTRGQAYIETGAAKKAEADLSRALEWTAERRTRESVSVALGSLRENHLKDDAGALDVYRHVVAGKTQISRADEFAAAQGIARILTRAKKFDDALAALHLADIDQLHGHWRGAMFLSLGDTLAAAGRAEEAEKAYRAILTDTTTEPAHRQAAEKRLR